MQAEQQSAIQACETRDFDLLQTTVPQFIEPNLDLGVFHLFFYMG